MPRRFRVENIGDVLLAIEDGDAGVGQRRSHPFDVALAGIGTVRSGDPHPADPVEEMRRMHEETHPGHAGTGTGGHTSAEMNEMHAKMSARLSEEDRALHDRMHDACSGHTDERDEI